MDYGLYVDLRGRIWRRHTRACALGRDREDAGMEREEWEVEKGKPRKERINREQTTRTVCQKTKEGQEKTHCKKKEVEDERTNRINQQLSIPQQRTSRLWKRRRSQLLVIHTTISPSVLCTIFVPNQAHGGVGPGGGGA
jgi:hypothetical protein